MRVLLDECVDRRLAPLIVGHTVSTVTGEGWSGMKNGELLRRAGTVFDVLVTVDKGIPAQVRRNRSPLPLVVLRATSNRLADLAPLIPQLLLMLGQEALPEVSYVP